MYVVSPNLTRLKLALHKLTVEALDPVARTTPLPVFDRR
jgi:hypothetical protein